MILKINVTHWVSVKPNYRLRETLIKWLRRRIAALRSARNPHVPGRTFRFLRAARLALHPPHSLNQRLLSTIACFAALALPVCAIASQETRPMREDNDVLVVTQHIDVDASRSAVDRASAETQRASAEVTRAVQEAARAGKEAARAAADVARAAVASIDANEIRDTVRRAMDEAGRGGMVYQMSGETPQRGNPYSAREVREFKQTLADGTVISRQSTRLLARDSEGRTRQELRQSDGTARIFINDPVAKEAIIVDPQKRMACKATFHKEAIYDCFSQMRGDWKPLGFAFNASSKGGIGMMSASDDVRVNVNTNAKIIDLTDGEMTRSKSGVYSYSASGSGTASASPGSLRLESPQPPQPPQPPVPPSPPTPNTAKHKDGAVKRERSTQTYEGLRVDVDRSVETIAAGAIGNNRAIESISERYYSPDLKMNVFTRRSDPRNGESTYRMVDVKRGEPEINQFRVPAGFAETQGKR